MRNLVIVLGDQLDLESAAFDGFDPAQDRVWMAEVAEETDHVWAHKLRIAFFLSAMRHFRDALEARGWAVEYSALTADPGEDRGRDHAALLVEDVARLEPERLIVVEPGDLRVQEKLQRAAEATGRTLEIREDRHFYITPRAFAAWAEGRKRIVLETFYRMMRKAHGVLLTADGEPEGGAWNFDGDNRKAFPKAGPPALPPTPRMGPDETTAAVIAMVEARFAEHPGVLDHFDLPVTAAQAQALLDDFVLHRLPYFGTYQDALWEKEPFLFHSRLSAPLNLKLISPRACVDAAIQAYRDRHAPLNAVEGFVRQILGWREMIRGIYWLHMPGYAELNALEAEAALPELYWTGDTDMACLRDAMQAVLHHGYSHHIQRLMVLGLFAQLYGANPRRFHEWHLAMYVDAVDWVSLPNALGMSQYGDGGIVGTKPYCASGAYIDRMSNHCRGCRYTPKQAVGETACPFTTLYWDFLDRHEARLGSNHRMGFQLRNLRRKSNEERKQIRAHAQAVRARLAAVNPS